MNYTELIFYSLFAEGDKFVLSSYFYTDYDGACFILHNLFSIPKVCSHLKRTYFSCSSNSGGNC